MERPRIVITLTANMDSLTMAQRTEFQLTLKADNQGLLRRDPELDLVKLNINGEPSFAWGLTLGNGIRSNDWYALPSGKSVQRTFKLGEALFPEPGTYTLDVLHKEVRLSQMTIIVK